MPTAVPLRSPPTERREVDLRRMGFTVIRYTWSQVQFEAASVAADLRRLLRAK